MKDCEPVRGAVEGGMGIGGEEGRRRRMMIGLLWSMFSSQLGVKLDWVINNLKDRGKIHLNLINKKSRV